MSLESLPDPLAVALDVAAILERMDITYLVAGSLASSVHGEPRSTLDVDMVVAILPHHVERLSTELRPGYYVDVDAAREAVDAGGSFNAIHVGSAVKVDLFVAGDDAFEAERLRLRERIRIDSVTGAALFIDKAEHSIVRKLEWFRRGGEVSERQWRDVHAMVRVQGPRLDRERLERWASALGVADLLARLLNEAEP